MKAEIHPKYVECQVSCACGNKFQTYSVRAEIRTDICSACHPFYTGAAKFVDSAGRVDKFLKRYGKKEAAKS
jgi:large subunit ribosomal protein L31